MNILANISNRQRGATLVVALVMLLALTLLVVSAIRSSNTNLRIAGNMQIQGEVIAAAQQATEVIISNDFWTTPAASNVSVTLGLLNYTVAVSPPACSGSVPLLNSTPNLPADCLSSGAAQNTGMVSASGIQVTGTSWCFAQQWEIQATPQGTNTTLRQGVSLNVPLGTSC